MTVTVDATDSGATGGNGGSITTLSYTGLTTTAAATAIIATLQLENGTAQPTGVTVNWDSAGVNQSMPVISGASNTTATAGEFALTAVYGLASPSSSGNKTIKATWTTVSNAYLAGMSFAGSDTTSPFANGTSATGTSTAPSISVTSATGNQVSGIVADTGTGFASVGQTKNFSSTALTYNAAGNYTAGAASTTLSCTTNSSALWIYAATSINVPAGGDVLHAQIVC